MQLYILRRLNNKTNYSYLDLDGEGVIGTVPHSVNVGQPFVLLGKRNTPIISTSYVISKKSEDSRIVFRTSNLCVYELQPIPEEVNGN